MATEQDKAQAVAGRLLDDFATHMAQALASLPPAQRLQLAYALAVGLLAAGCGLTRTLGIGDEQFLALARTAVAAAPRMATA